VQLIAFDPARLRAISHHRSAGFAIAAGTAAVWEEGEEHETTSDEGLVAVVVEAAALEP
jgi:hypothetical protein